MKKILFLLLLTVATYGQTTSGQETEFDYGIRNNASQLDDNATFITVQNSDGTLGKSTSSVWAKKIYVDNANAKKAFLSTGLIKNGLIQIGTSTTFNITAGIGVISNFDDPENPTSTIVSFPAFTGITPTYLTSGNITYVAINSSATVVMQASPFTDIQRRDLIILGAVVHSNLSTINTVNNISAPTNSGTNQLHDLMEAIGSLNISGNKYTANGANLLLNKSAGDIFKLGVNFANNWKDPHKLNIASGTALSFRYRTQNGTEGSDVTVLNPAVYDVANVLTAVPSNRFSIQTVTLFQTGLTRIQYGQATYATMSEAEASITTRSYNVEANIAANGITRAYIILKNNTTSLQNASDCKIVEAGKFGNVSGSGGAITLDAIIAALGYTPENLANKSDSYTVSSSITYSSTKALVDGLGTKVGGTLTTNYIPKATGSSTLGNSLIYDNGTNVGIGTTTDNGVDKLQVNGSVNIVGNLIANYHILNTTNPTSTAESGGTMSIYHYPDKSAPDSFYWASRDGSNSDGFGDTGISSSAEGGTQIFSTSLDGSSTARITTSTSGANVSISTTGTGTSIRLTSPKTQIVTAPTTSAGTYDILTRNSSTGVVEKKLNADFVHISGEETIAGVKSFTDSPKFNSGILDIYDTTDTSYTNFSVDDREIKFSSGGVPYLRFNSGVLEFGGSQISKTFVTTPRNYNLPDASGTIALSETIKPYKVYTALLSQSGTSAPVATVLENTLGGTVVWNRATGGVYHATLTGAFASNKTAIFVTNRLSTDLLRAYRYDANIIYLESSNGDGNLLNNTIEIRVYN